MASEREKEIKRRRKRRKQITQLRARAAKATGSEKQVIADKLRNMTPGYKTLIDSMGLAKK
jgi:2-methylaconitate cis-trans-isomerase PrpF